MKDLITTIASILLLMIFILQFAGNQVLHTRLFQSDMAVESFRDTMKEQGGISEENRQNLIRELADICGCTAEDITVEGHGLQGESAVRGMLLYYRIRFPMQNLIVMGNVLGIGVEENMVWMDQEGWVVNRYEEPDHNNGNSPSDDHGDSL